MAANERSSRDSLTNNFLLEQKIPAELLQYRIFSQLDPHASAFPLPRTSFVPFSNTPAWGGYESSLRDHLAHSTLATDRHSSARTKPFVRLLLQRALFPKLPGRTRQNSALSGCVASQVPQSIAGNWTWVQQSAASLFRRYWLKNGGMGATKGLHAKLSLTVGDGSFLRKLLRSVSAFPATRQMALALEPGKRVPRRGITKLPLSRRASGPLLPVVIG